MVPIDTAQRYEDHSVYRFAVDCREGRFEGPPSHQVILVARDGLKGFVVGEKKIRESPSAFFFKLQLARLGLAASLACVPRRFRFS